MSSLAVREVTVLGEALVDVVSANGLRTRLPGGSPLNVAVGLGRLGRTTSLVARVGEDDLGDTLRPHLAGSGVDLSALVSVSRTSTALARIGTDGGAAYEFDVEWALPATLHVPRSRLLHIGSIGSWMDPGAQVVGELVHRRPSHQVASFDPNVRPSLISDRRSALSRVEGLVADVDLVKLSDEDADWLYPERTRDEVLDRLLGLGASVAVITLGSRGAIARSTGSRVFLPAPPALVADTIGAGDSFMAGLLDAWLEANLVTGADLSQERLTNIVRHALSAAAITVSRPGADPPWRRELSLRAKPPGLAGRWPE